MRKTSIIPCINLLIRMYVSPIPLSSFCKVDTLDRLLSQSKASESSLKTFQMSPYSLQRLSIPM
eukprot:UN25204